MPATITLEIKRTDAPGLLEQDYSAMMFSSLFLSLDIAYQAACDGLDYPPHHLTVHSVYHPNMSISLSGLKEPIEALRDLLAAVPNLLACLVNMRGIINLKNESIRNELLSLEIRNEVLQMVKDNIAAMRQSCVVENDERLALSASLKDQIESLPMEILSAIRNSTLNSFAIVVPGSERPVAPSSNGMVAAE